jgi:hypothetical protein
MRIDWLQRQISLEIRVISVPENGMRINADALQRGFISASDPRLKIRVIRDQK